jgi:hypothetical protein
MFRIMAWVFPSTSAVRNVPGILHDDCHEAAWAEIDYRWSFVGYGASTGPQSAAKNIRLNLKER